MASTKTQRPAVPVLARSATPEEIKKLLRLIRGAKSIELKASVPMPEHRAVVRSIGLDPVEAEVRQVYFFDTADQALNRAGLIVRARRRPGGRADTVIKLRPVDPATIDPKLMHSQFFKVELDAMPDGTFVCSASYKGDATSQAVRKVADGAKPISSLFSREQLHFYEAHVPPGIDLDSLLPQGPILLLRAKHQPKEFKRGLTAELWLWPDGKRTLELSFKCLPDEAFHVAVEARLYLTEHGIDLGAKQETKTRTAMQKLKGENAAKRRTGKNGKAAQRPS
jgi:hypothetical protein